jgi:hypothetical protein
MKTPHPDTLQFIVDLGYNRLMPQTQHEAHRLLENLTGCIDKACTRTYTGWRFTPEPIRREIMIAVKCSMLYHKLRNDMDYSSEELDSIIRKAISEENYRTLGFHRARQRPRPLAAKTPARRRRNGAGGLVPAFIFLLLCVVAVGALYYLRPGLMHEWVQQLSFSSPEELLIPTPAPTATTYPTVTPQPTPTPRPPPTATPVPSPVPEPDWRARAQELYWQHKANFNGPQTGDIIRVKTTVGQEITGKVTRLSPKIIELRTRTGQKKFMNTQIIKEQRLKLFSYDYARHMARQQVVKERKAFANSWQSAGF